MASYLYRLGRFSARRAWAVVLAWLLVLGLLAAGAGTLGKPFTSKLSIPGTEFQRILDDLQTSLPQAAAGVGTVVFTTDSGQPFTAAQKSAVNAVITEWGSIDGVDSTVNPFTTQTDLDAATTKIADGKKQLADAETQIATNTKKIADGKAQLAAGQKELDTNAAKLADGKQQLAAAQSKLVAGQNELNANQAKLNSSRQQLNAAAAKVSSGRQQLNAAKAQIASGQKQLTAAKQQVASGKQQIAAGQQQLATQRQQLVSAQQQATALGDQYGENDSRAVQARQQVSQETAQVNAAQQQITTKTRQIAAAERTITTKSAELAAGQKKIAAQEPTVVAGERKIASGRAELAAGTQKLNAAKQQLAAGKQTLATNQAQLSQGETALAQGKAKLEASKKQLADGEKQLAEARSKIAGSEAELQRGEARVQLTQGLRTVSSKGDVAMAQVLFTEPINSVPVTTKDSVISDSSSLAQAGVQVDYAKDLSEDLGSIMGPGELIGLAIAGLVLLVMLGSLLAAGLPLLTAVIGVAVGVLGAVTLTHWVTMNDVTPALALMLGLAVGIDYALFLVNRHREQLARGVEIEESIAKATGTAGGAVLFAGLTVITALAALTLTGIPFLGLMGLVAAATVAVAVLISITLTPALLKLMGHRALSGRARRKLAEQLEAEDAAEAEAIAPAANVLHGEHSAAEHEGRGRGWGGLVTRHPWVTLGASIVALVALAIPAASLKLGLPDGAYEPHDTTGYRTYASVGDNFGAGANGPIIAVAKSDKAASMSADQLTDLELKIGAELKATSGVDYVVPVGASDDQKTLAFQVVPTTGPSEDATADLVHTLRADAPSVVADSGIDSIGYTGQTVANIDISKALSDALPLYLSVVVGISLLLLLLVFRSLLVPVLATAGFLLSVAAAFGAVVAVYQWGWLGSLFGVEHPGLVLSFLPTLVIGILFGLAMDYQMFLVSGMREAWAHGQPARTAVRSGFSHGARVVTAAALIMLAVFGSFVHAHLAMIRPIGFALAIGVLIDAFVIRMTAMPAIMYLIGEKAWYLPKWLRWLPDLDVEGTKLVAAQEKSAPAGSGGARPAEPGGDGTDSGPIQQPVSANS